MNARTTLRTVGKNGGIGGLMAVLCWTLCPTTPALAQNVYPFSTEMSGPFTTTPISTTIFQQHQDLVFTGTSPFPLTSGTVVGFDDVTLPFPARFFNGVLNWSGPDGDSLLGTVVVQTSTFTDPVDPAHGDFVGAEDFTGTFTFTGGTGRYLDATGGGTYAAHSVYGPPIAPGTLFFGSSNLVANGQVTVVPEPLTLGLAAVGAGMLMLRRRRRGISGILSGTTN